MLGSHKGRRPRPFIASDRWDTLGVHPCCFCEQNLGESDSLTLIVTAADRRTEENAPRQQVWCHPDCLGQRLAPSVPFDPQGFFE